MQHTPAASGLRRRASVDQRVYGTRETRARIRLMVRGSGVPAMIDVQLRSCATVAYHQKLANGQADQGVVDAAGCSGSKTLWPREDGAQVGSRIHVMRSVMGAN